jgi:hypothetical protein
MSVDLPAKLRLTTAALGCASEEDLCDRFRAINAATECRAGRVRSWLHGRGRPRTSRLYADWAAALGTDRPGSWIAECTLDAFRDEVCSLHGAHLAARDVLAPAADRAGSHANLCGTYACYSHAWSPDHRGQIIRGALRILMGAGPELRAIYSETLLGDSMRMAGAVEVTSGTVHMLLREPGSLLPVFLALSLPPPPAALLCGIMAGPCFVVDHSLPTGTRILAIRVPDSPHLEASNRYLPKDGADFAGDLADLGLPIQLAPGLDQKIAAFLPLGADQVAPEELAALTSLLDPLQQAMAPARAPGRQRE